MTVDEQLRAFRDAAASWPAVRTDFRAANELSEELHSVYMELRETREGRSALLSLLNDLDPWVRGEAAVRSLEWESKRAVAVLDALAGDNALPTDVTMAAAVMIRAWRAGTLSFPLPA